MSLRVWLPLNGNLNNQGCSNVTVTNNGATVNTSGKTGSCYSCNGNGNYITGNFNATTDISFCLWFNLPTLSNGHLIDARSNEVGYQPLYIYDDGKLQSGNSQNGFPVFNSAFQTNKWYHICIVYTNTNCTIYINGEKFGSETLGAGYNFGNSTFTLCSRHNYTNSISAKINDFRIYDHALSAKEVKEISKALICHYPLDGNGKGNDNLLDATSANEVVYSYPTSGGYVDKWSRNTVVVPSATNYTLSFWAKSSVNGNKIYMYFYNPNTVTKAESSQGEISTSADGLMFFILSDKWEKYWVTYTQSTTTSVKTVILPRLWKEYGTGTVSIKQVKLEEGTKATPWCPNINDSEYSSLGYNSLVEYDTSGYKYNGTRNGTLTNFSDTPKYSAATTFNGSNTSISYHGLNLGNEWSYGIWYRNADLTRGWETAILLNNDGEDTDTQLGFWTNQNQKKLQSTANGQYNSQIEIPNDTNWHHFFATFDGSVLKTYLDGILKDTKTITASLLAKPNLTVGARSANSLATSFAKNFNGTLSDFRLYATVLSADDVKELYQTSALIDNNGIIYAYNFEEV